MKFQLCRVGDCPSGTHFPRLLIRFHVSQALRFLGLLSGSSSKYMPNLFAVKTSASYPATLPPLLADIGSRMIAESVASCLFRATERVHDA